PGESVVSFPSREVRRVETPAGAVYVKILPGFRHPGVGWQIEMAGAALARRGNPAHFANPAGRGLPLRGAAPGGPSALPGGLADRPVYQPGNPEQPPGAAPAPPRGRSGPAVAGPGCRWAATRPPGRVTS